MLDLGCGSGWLTGMLTKNPRIDEIRAQALAGGAMAVIDKPFDDQVLLDAVAKAVARTRS